MVHGIVHSIITTAQQAESSTDIQSFTTTWDTTTTWDKSNFCTSLDLLHPNSYLIVIYDILATFYVYT
jgi:hypothetical protein